MATFVLIIFSKVLFIFIALIKGAKINSTLEEITVRTTT